MIARAIGVAAAVAVLIALVANAAAGTLSLQLIAITIAVASYLLSGVLIIERRPGNVVGPLVLLLGLALVGYVLLDAIVHVASPEPATVAALLVHELDGPMFLIVAMLLLLFPDGALPSPAWRWLVVAGVALATIVALGALFRPGPYAYYPWIENPLGDARSPLLAVWDAAYALEILVVALAAISLVGRWRHGGPVERAQIKWVAVAGAILAGAMLAYGVIAGPGPESPPLVELLFVAMVASLGLVGALLATRIPANRVGWILWVAATMVMVSTSGGDYVRLSLAKFDGTLPGTVAVAWLSSVTFLPATIMIIVLVPLYFPDGVLLSARWRLAVVLGLVGVAIAVIQGGFAPGPLPNTTIQNPLGVDAYAQLADVLGIANVLVALIALPLGIAAIVLRFRRGNATTRQQIRWFAAAAGLACGGLLVAVMALGTISDAGWVVGILGLVTLPVAIGVAVLRYRLYELDRIISRSIAYAIVTGILGVTFALTILALQAALDWLIGGQTIAVAVSTLVAAALFQPLRARVQRVVDRRFDRARVDRERTASGFSERLRGQVAIESIAGDLQATIDASIKPTGQALWLRDARGRWPSAGS